LVGGLRSYSGIIRKVALWLLLLLLLLWICHVLNRVVVVVVRYCKVVMGVQGIIGRKVNTLAVIVAVNSIMGKSHVCMVMMQVIAVVVIVCGSSIVVTAVLTGPIVGM
jgi:hypothetical protein